MIKIGDITVRTNGILKKFKIYVTRKDIDIFKDHYNMSRFYKNWTVYTSIFREEK